MTGRPPEGGWRVSPPVSEWSVIDTRRTEADDDVVSTLFAVSNGYIGIRDQSGEPSTDAPFGTFVNGVHETWTIRYPENAHALARTGQTMVPVHDCLGTLVAIDGAVISEFGGTAIAHHRELDLRSGVALRRVRHRLATGVVVEVSTERLVSLTERHLASARVRVTVIEGRADVGVEALCRVPGAAGGAAIDSSADPRRTRQFDHQVLEPVLRRSGTTGASSGVFMTMVDRCHHSRVAVACSLHLSSTVTRPEGCTGLDLLEEDPSAADEVCRHRAGATLGAGESIEVVRVISFHTASPGDDTGDEVLADRAEATASAGAERSFDDLIDEQQRWLDAYFTIADVIVDGATDIQQAVRWHLFHLAQAGACVDGTGIPAKALTADGYEGHYFWDTEVYLVPFLARTLPESSRRLIEFRHRHLDAARRRAREMSQRGALFPWRTINGEEASAYYPAGTAQYHIDAAVIHALDRHHVATGDDRLLVDIGAELLVETARLWADLGFHGSDGRFHINRVTGPDEYSAVVNDNVYTNLMARFNLRWAADLVERLRAEWPAEHARLCAAIDLSDDEVEAWRRAAAAMAIPYDDTLGIHGQDDGFLDLEPWDFAGTPPEKHPLLLHFHPLVIYRHQVLKQADVVLAMLLREDEFDLGQRRRNFDFYDPLTTGDSSLSACVQATVAAQVGRTAAALDYFLQALRLDLDDCHHNTIDGVHIANSGGVWASLVHGFVGVRFRGDTIVLDSPAATDSSDLPWSALEVGFLHRGIPCRVRLADGRWTVHNRGTSALTLVVGDRTLYVDGGRSLSVERPLGQESVGDDGHR